MNYQDELRAKLDAVRPIPSIKQAKPVTTSSIEEKLLSELADEFEFSQYDLDENDILRTLKIMNILKSYDGAFSHSESLKVFYTITRVDIISPKSLHAFLEIEVLAFKKILKQMANKKLIFQNNDKELELTLEGKSLAGRLGMYVF